GYADNFAWGKLVLGAGDSLELNGDAVYVRSLVLQAGLGQIDSIIGNGSNIYYDLAQPENAYLQGQTYALSGGGSITPLPEPLSASVILLALDTLASRRRKTNSYCKCSA